MRRPADHRSRGLLGRAMACAPAALACIAAGEAAAQPRCAYTVRYDPADAPAILEVTVRATGLCPTDGSWALVLDGWGGWPDLAHPYIRISSAEPPLGPRTGTEFPILAPAQWNGSLAVSYTIPVLEIGSEEQRAHTILPAADDSYLMGAIANTIARIFAGGEPVKAERTIRFEGPPGWKVFTGWAGGSEQGRASVLPPPGENAVFAIGLPIEVRTADEGGLRFEVFQFTGGERAAEIILEITRAFVGHVTRTLGHGPPEPVRVCITGTTGGGYLTDHGLVVGLPVESPAWILDSPYYRHLVCHELFHIWLGHLLREAESERTVWFKEGFTDYLSLWHGAACGVLPRRWLGERMLEIEADARNSSFGTVAFTDPAVEWRDGDGPNETMAYKGGAVLVMAMDVELRLAGRGGVPALVRGMIDDGQTRYSNDTIRSRVRSMGLESFERRHVSGTQAPSVRDALLRLGYEQRRMPTPLAYIGVRTQPGEGLGHIAAIDPAGPAADAGFLIGDVIGGLAPARSDGAAVGEDMDTDYPFGLTLIAPAEDPVSVWVHRGSADPVEVRIVPRLIPGGVRREFVATEAALRTLFGGG